MEKILKRLFLILSALSIPIGFFVEHEHAVFFWHRIPSIEAIFGFFGTFVLILATAILTSFAQKRENFYD
jgi:hypothetical protein